MQRLALLTGATGFVGTHLAEHLHAGGWRLRALVRPSSDTARLRALGVELCEGSLGDAASIARAAEGAEVLFHLAAVNFARTEEEFQRANVAGTRHVVEALAAAARPPRRLVHLSSYAAVGPAPAGRARTSEDPPAPLTAYGRSKLGAEAEALAARERGTEVIVVRAPAVYGPGDRALLSYYRLVRWGLAPSPAGSAQRLQVVHARDLAGALARAADAPEGTFCVADPVQHSWRELTDAIAAALGRRPLRLALPPALVRGAAAATEAAGRWMGGGQVPFNREKAEEILAEGWVCDLSGSETLLPREAATPLSAGIAETVEWYIRQGWL